MSSSTERTLKINLWWIGFQPPTGGYAGWKMFSKSPEYQERSWGMLPFPLFYEKEDAEKAFAENGFDKETHRVVQVKITITEIEE